MKLSESAYYSSEFGLYHNHCQAMGTRLDAVIHGVEQDAGERAFEKICSELVELENKLSRFDEKSQISMINQLGSKQVIVIDSELFSILSQCRDYYEKTSGLFDVSIGKVISEARRNSSDSKILLKMLNESGMDKISLDPEKCSVRFLNEHVEIDLGGFGKGYALDRLKSLLHSMDISDAFISFGDSSILALGNHPHGKGWKSGVNNLLKPGESLFEFDLIDESLSTSGTGPNNTRGDRQGHVLHPGRGLIDPGYQHISVVSHHAVEAEVLSTALLVASDEEKSDLLEKFPACRAIEIKYDPDGNTHLRNFNDHK
ncbi:FAD:protein FMN transferase [Bacteroidota bacterium]